MEAIWFNIHSLGETLMYLDTKRSWDLPYSWSVYLKSPKGSVIQRGKQFSVRQNKANSWNLRRGKAQYLSFKWYESIFCSGYSIPLLPPYVLWFLRDLEVFDTIFKPWRSACVWETLNSFKKTDPLAPLQNDWVRTFTNGVWLTVALKEFYRGFWFVSRVMRPCFGVIKLSLDGLLSFLGGTATWSLQWSFSKDY